MNAVYPPFTRSQAADSYRGRLGSLSGPFVTWREQSEEHRRGGVQGGASRIAWGAVSCRRSFCLFPQGTGGRGTG